MAGAGSDGAPHIDTPLRGVTNMQRFDRREPLLLRAEAGSVGKLLWLAADSLLGSTKPGEALSGMPPRAGRYVLRVVDERGLADSREVIVEAAE